jgi:penicillin-binding protein 1A
LKTKIILKDKKVIPQKIKKVLYGIIGLGVCGVLIAVTAVIIFSLSLPKISNLSDYNPNIPSQILAKDGTVLAEIGKEKRYIVQMSDIPKRIIDSIVSAEDSGFYDHKGVEYLGLLRALIVNLKEGRYAQGGSTITQQVAKSLLLSNERSISRKVKDMLLAHRIENRFSKDEILFLYLNQVYLGGGYYGIKAAFDGYFNKELKEATVAEAAMVAGLLVAPGKYSPYINPKRAKIRQGYVLKRMFDTGRITKKEYDEALAEKTQFRIRKPQGFLAGYFTDWVRQRVVALVGEDDFLTGGYKVKTTLDYELQKVAEREVKRTVKDIDKRQGYKGAIKTIEKDGQLNWILEERKKLLKSNSNYFTITEDYKKKLEIELDEKQLEERIKDQEDFRSIVKNKRLHLGNSKNDQVISSLKKDQTHKGIVFYVDDWARAVYVNVSGVVGVIPYDGFRWVHERNVSKERDNYSYLTKPSTMIKVGDVLLVTIVKLESSLKKLTDKSFNKGFLAKLSKNKKKEVEKQRYMTLLLDQEPEVQGALYSVEPFSGEIVSMVGGYNFLKSQFNRALQSRRQPGSSFKPLLYAAALENGYNPSSIIIDSPETLGGVDEGLNWKPRNYDGKFKGPITFRNSLEQSRNVTTIKIASDLGVDKVVKFSERIGFNAELDKDLSLALGSFGVTLQDIVATYAIFPNGGLKLKPKSIVAVYNRNEELISFNEEDKIIEDAEGDSEIDDAVISDSDIIKDENSDGNDEKDEVEKKVNKFLDHLKGDQVYDRRLAYLMSNLLRGVVLHGTGRGTRSVSPYLGGKTGTTNDYVDAWFIGFSPRLATGVWTGFDDNGTLGWGETGAKSALPIWREFMRAGVKKYGEVEFTAPLGIVNVKIDKETGQPIKDRHKSGFLEAFVDGEAPGDLKVSDEKDQESDKDTTILEDDDYYNNQ